MNTSTKVNGPNLAYKQFLNLNNRLLPHTNNPTIVNPTLIKSLHPNTTNSNNTKKNATKEVSNKTQATILSNQTQTKILTHSGKLIIYNRRCKDHTIHSRVKDISR